MLLLFSCYIIPDSFMTPWTAVFQDPLSMGFSMQYWIGLPFPSPSNLPDPEIEPAIQETWVRSLMGVADNDGGNACTGIGDI